MADSHAKCRDSSTPTKSSGGQRSCKGLRAEGSSVVRSKLYRSNFVCKMVSLLVDWLVGWLVCFVKTLNRFCLNTSLRIFLHLTIK